MLTKAFAAKLYAEAIDLPNGNFVRALSLETVCAKCNGVGAEWMEHVILLGGKKTLLQIANELYGWAMPATLRHDVRYAVGGTAEMRRNDDKCFLEDCLWIARKLFSNEPWWNPMSYVRLVRRIGQAKRMYVLLRAFGWLAYNFDNAEDRENEEWISGERANIAQAEYVKKLPTTETR
ncbi:MAG: hypothetical protein J5654_09740 [Victivallales bacterium]|nr:hypothetical protein [Victivallales bacterium]